MSLPTHGRWADTQQGHDLREALDAMPLALAAHDRLVAILAYERGEVVPEGWARIVDEDDNPYWRLDLEEEEEGWLVIYDPARFNWYYMRPDEDGDEDTRPDQIFTYVIDAIEAVNMAKDTWRPQ